MVRSWAVGKVCVFCLVLLGLAAVGATPSGATVIRGGLGTGNVGAPTNDPGWDNVVLVSGGSGVYLGNRWVLTAAHVWNNAPTSAKFGEVSYTLDTGSWQGLELPGSPGTASDLGLFRLTSSPPGLSGLSIGTQAPIANSEVVGIGYGRDRAESETFWDVSGGVWTEGSPPGDESGFGLKTTRTKRWGKNHIDVGGAADLQASGYTTSVLRMTFDRSGGAGDDEMQAVTGDSGGAMLYERNGVWELAGIWIAREPLEGQPSLTAVYGNYSYAADLSLYEGQIMAIIPEPSTLAMLLGLGVLVLLTGRGVVLSVCRRARIGR